jgi:sulfur relay (sulfurtransferase) complex TusBCD TusD component (DsrE family)
VERAAPGRAPARRVGTQVKVFLLGDAVGCAVAGQKVPEGYYHLDGMLESAARHGAEVGCCGTCLGARGLTDACGVPEVCLACELQRCTRVSGRP